MAIRQSGVPVCRRSEQDEASPIRNAILSPLVALSSMYFRSFVYSLRSICTNVTRSMEFCTAVFYACGHNWHRTTSEPHRVAFLNVPIGYGNDGAGSDWNAAKVE